MYREFKECGSDDDYEISDPIQLKADTHEFLQYITGKGDTYDFEVCLRASLAHAMIQSFKNKMNRGNFFTFLRRFYDEIEEEYADFYQEEDDE